MKFLHASKQLSAGMRISRGGFTRRDHILATPFNFQEDLVDSVAPDMWCDVIASVHDFKRAIQVYSESIESVDLLLPVDESYESLLRSETYPEKNSTLYAILCSLSTTYQLKSLPAKKMSIEVLERAGCYASNSYWEDDVSTMIRNSSSIILNGVSVVKHHVGVSSAQDEAHRCNKLIEEALLRYPESLHCFDLNCAYDYDQALAFCRGISAELSGSILWIEEPLHHTMYPSLYRLQDHVSYPIAAGENAFGYHELLRLTNDIAFTMPDLGRNCDFLSLQRLAESAKFAGSKITLHNYGSSLLFHKTLQSYSRVGSLSYIECDFSRNPLFNSYRSEHTTVDEWILKCSTNDRLSIGSEWTVSQVHYS